MNPTAQAYMMRAETYGKLEKNNANIQKRWQDIQIAHILEPNDQKIIKEFKSEEIIQNKLKNER